jgi:hypothetical protein
MKTLSNKVLVTSFINAAPNDYYLIRDELLRRLEELDEIYAQHKMVMLEKCPTDEVHCTCVPMLRHELKKTREEIEEIKKCRDCPFCGQRQCMRKIL